MQRINRQTQLGATIAGSRSCILGFGKFIQQHLGFGRQQMRSVRISIVQCLLGLLQVVAYLRRRRLSLRSTVTV